MPVKEMKIRFLPPEAWLWSWFVDWMHKWWIQELLSCPLPSFPSSIPLLWYQEFILLKVLFFCWKCRKFRQLPWKLPKANTNKIHILLLKELKTNNLKPCSCRNPPVKEEKEVYIIVIVGAIRLCYQGEIPLSFSLPVPQTRVQHPKVYDSCIAGRSGRASYWIYPKT